MKPIVITPEERDLLAAAKDVCQYMGHANGRIVTGAGHEDEALRALIKMIECAHLTVDGVRLYRTETPAKRTP